MKLTIIRVIAACMAIVAVQTASIEKDLEISEVHTFEVDKAMVEKNMMIMEILYKVSDDLLMEHWIKLGGKLNVDKSLYLKYDEYMERFYDHYKMGWLLPKGEFFSSMQKPHITQAIGLFNFFYYAKDWDTLVQNLVWARMNVNEGMFVYACSLAFIHREDTKGIILPKIYEIFPNMFYSSKYIWEMKKFDWDSWNMKIMLEKEMKSIYDQKIGEMYGDQFYMKDWKIWQWWKLMGLDYGWHWEKMSMLRDNIDLLINDPMWISIWKEMQMVWLPVDYSRDIEIFNEESKLSYFTEDVDWNAYWYYLNMDYPLALPGKEFKLKKERRGEWWFYNTQQMLARYNMERLSNNFPVSHMISLTGMVEPGYNPQLISWNGSPYTVRKNYWEIHSHQNLHILNKVLSIERRMDDLIASSKFEMKDGTVIDMSKPEAIEYIGNIIQGNIDIIDKDLFGFFWFLVSNYWNDGEYNAHVIEPNCMMNTETMMRDPMMYQLLEYIVSKYYLAKDKHQPYTKEELHFHGVKILKADISELMTYFDFVDRDVTTLLNEKMMFHDGKLVWDKVLLARQKRLNHKPFTYELQVESDKIQKAVVRAFLLPLFDDYGQRLSLTANRDNCMEIDEYVVDLVAGKNMLLRSSEDFEWTSGDSITYSEWYNYMKLAYDGKYQFMQNMSEPHHLFPDNLMLPMGWVKGMPMGLFFMISSYDDEMKMSPAYGYPLDRKIYNSYDFYVPNMITKTVKIYHTEKYDKYFPKKWEKYGEFDYSY